MHPEGFGRRVVKGPCRFVDVDPLDHVALQHQADRQARGPVGQERPQRQMQLVQRQSVTVRPLPGHRQPARHFRLSAAVTAVTAVSSVVAVTVVAGSLIITFVPLPCAVISLPVSARVGRGRGRRVPDGRWTEEGTAGVQRVLHLVSRAGVHPGARCGHVPPQPLQWRPQLREVGTGHEEEIGLRRSGRLRPVARSQQSLGGQPDRRPARHGRQQHVRSRRGDTQGQAGQVHRSAPSRHA